MVDNADATLDVREVNIRMRRMEIMRRSGADDLVSDIESEHVNVMVYF